MSTTTDNCIYHSDARLLLALLVHLMEVPMYVAVLCLLYVQHCISKTCCYSVHRCRLHDCMSGSNVHIRYVSAAVDSTVKLCLMLSQNFFQGLHTVSVRC